MELRKGQFLFFIYLVRNYLLFEARHEEICSCHMRKTAPLLFAAQIVRIRIRIVYWWNAETTITHQDLWLGN